MPARPQSILHLPLLVAAAVCWLAPAAAAEPPLTQQRYRQVLQEDAAIAPEQSIEAHVAAAGAAPDVAGLAYLDHLAQQVAALEARLRSPGLEGAEYARIAAGIGAVADRFAMAREWFIAHHDASGSLSAELAGDVLQWKGTPWALTVCRYYQAILTGYYTAGINAKIARQLDLMATNLPLRDPASMPVEEAHRLFLFARGKRAPDEEDVAAWRHLARFAAEHPPEAFVASPTEDEILQRARLQLVDLLIELNAEQRVAELASTLEARRAADAAAMAAKEEALHRERERDFLALAAALEDGRNGIDEIEGVIKAAKRMGPRLRRQHAHLPNADRIAAACGDEEARLLDAYFRLMVHDDDAPALALASAPSALTDPRAQFALAYAYAKRDDIEAAERHVRILLKLTPDDPYGRMFAERISQARAARAQEPAPR